MKRTCWQAVIPLVVGIQSAAAMADESPSADAADPDVLEQIVVTGSRIPRQNFIAVSPIVTLDRRAIELSGDLLVDDLLDDLPLTDPAVGAGTGNNFGGESFVNLRALGANRTLVLLDGRRYPSQGLNGAVNLNALPTVLIERIDVITGGASAVYGSDAMAGAVNFVLRRDFDGVESSAQFGVSDRGDGEQYHVDVAYGRPFSAERGRLVVFGEYFKRTRIFQDARAFSQRQIVSDDETGELREFGSFASDAASIAGVGPFYTFERDGSPRLYVEPDDRFDLSPYNPLQSPLERVSGALLAEYKAGDSPRYRVELSANRSRPIQLVADEFFDFVELNVDRPDLKPEFRQILANDADPDGDGIASVFLARTFSPERGTGTVVHESDFLRGLVGLDGRWHDDWRWRVDASYARNERDSRAVNDISISRLRQGLFVDPATGGCFDPGGGCVPVNPFGAGNLSRQAADFIGLTGSGFSERSTETYVTSGLDGRLLSLPAGDLDIALGAEHRRFEFENRFPNDNLQSGDSLFFGNGINPAAGTIAVREVHAEARVPLLRRPGWAEYLGLDIGIRASDYSTLRGAVWTWKAGVEWQVAGPLRFRVMRQRAIRAPGVAELFQGVNFAFTDAELGPLYDECSASRDPVGSGLAELCIAQGVPEDQLGVFEAGFFPVAVSFAPNPDVDAETANTLTAGFTWQSGRVSAAVDYFDIEIDNALATADHVDLVRLCFLSRDATSQACRTFTRAPSGDIDSGLITFINSTFAQSEGVDFALHVDWEPRSADLRLSIHATHYLDAGTRGTPLLPYLDCAGKFGAFCGLFAYQGAVPDRRLNARLSYDSAPYAASLRWRYIGALTNAEAEARHINGQPPGNLAVPRVSAESYFDLTLSRSIGRRTTLLFGVENLLDNDPPLLGNAARAANTDPTTYDVLGRRYFLRLSSGY